MIKTTLIDADIVTFQAAAGNEQTLSWGSDGSSLILDPDLALFKCRERISDIQRRTEAEEVLLCFSGSANFRYQALKTYKHNRRGKRKPKLLGSLREQLCDLYPNACENRLEADDLMGIYQAEDDSTCIATIDKDLDQIHGFHYNWKHDNLYDIPKREALWFQWFQVLTGDSTDGYKGIPGVGPKKADKILGAYRDDKLKLHEQEQEYAWACHEAYKAKDISDKDYHAQVAVAQILRDGMWDPEERMVLTYYKGY